MMIQIKDVEYLSDYKLELIFSTGEAFIVDLKNSLDAPAYRDLLDREKFIQFGLVRGTLEWYNQADFAPEYLYEIAKKQNKVHTG